MIPLDLANPLVGMAGITTGAGRYIAGRHAACSPGSRPGLDGRAVIAATGRPSPASVLFAMPVTGPPFAMPVTGPPFAAGLRGFHGRELKAAPV